jgi:hypothetical protein
MTCPMPNTCRGSAAFCALCPAVPFLPLFLIAVMAVGCKEHSRQIVPEEKLPQVKQEQLPELGEALGPYDDGRVQIAAPKGWYRDPRSSEYVVRYRVDRKQRLPAIVVTAEDFEPIQDTTEANVKEFCKHVTAALEKADKRKFLDSAVEPLVRERFAGATYALRSTYDGQEVQRRFIELVHKGRKYAIELQATKQTARKYWPYLVAVVEGMQFLSPGQGADGENTSQQPSGESGTAQPKPSDEQ